MTNPLSPTLGHVLRLSQGPVHCWLQHIAGVSDYSHGHSLQVQVGVTVWPPKSSFSKLFFYINHPIKIVHVLFLVN